MLEVSTRQTSDIANQASRTLPETPPAVPINPGVPAGNGKPDLSWTAFSGTVTGYDMHNSLADAAAVADDAVAGTSAAKAWVGTSCTGTNSPTAS